MRAHPARCIAVILLILGWVVAASAWDAATSGAAASRATVTVTPAAVAPNDRVVVELEHWPLGPVLVSVCGNAARRGSQDCDLINSVAVAVRTLDPVGVNFVVTAPPVGCPCVVQAKTVANDVVRAAPIALIGVPDGVDLSPDAPHGTPRQLAVTVSLERRQRGVGDSLFPPFAGPAHFTLTLMMRNRGATPLRGLRVVGAVGRNQHDSEPLPPARVANLPAGATRRVTIPVLLSVPAWGHYVVFGSVYGAAVPTTFAVTTKNDPWALELAIPVLLLVVAQILRTRNRRRAREAAAAAELAAASAAGYSPVLVGAARSFPESSPEVGDPYGESYGPSPYDHPQYEPMHSLVGDDIGPDLVGSGSTLPE